MTGDHHCLCAGTIWNNQRAYTGWEQTKTYKTRSGAWKRPTASEPTHIIHAIVPSLMLRPPWNRICRREEGLKPQVQSVLLNTINFMAATAAAWPAWCKFFRIGITNGQWCCQDFNFHQQRPDNVLKIAFCTLVRVIQNLRETMTIWHNLRACTGQEHTRTYKTRSGARKRSTASEPTHIIHTIDSSI